MSAPAPVPGKRPAWEPAVVTTGTRRVTFVTMSAALVAMLAAIVADAVARAQGHFSYALDDAYIHLAMARNLARFGVYGPTPLRYASASSSPLWTVTLAGLNRISPGVFEAFPLVLATGFALGVLAFFAFGQDYVQVHAGRPGLWLAAVLLPALLFLPGLVAGGMEATAFILVALLITTLFARTMTSRLDRRQLVVLLVLTALAPMIRFETVFLVAACVAAAVTVPLLIEGRRPPLTLRPLSPLAIALVMCALVATALAIYAAVNISHGEYAFPNSITAKSDLGAPPLVLIGHVYARFLNNFLDDALLAGLLVAGVYQVIREARARRAGDLGLTVIAVVAVILHLCFADTGGFLRYQAYLVAIGILLVLREAARTRERNNQARRWQLMGGIVLLTLFGLGLPRLYFTIRVPDAQLNIYQQQAQVAGFFATEYAGEPVADDDIGWVSYLHRGPLLDLRALGSFEVLRALKQGHYDDVTIEAIARRQGTRAIALHEPVVGPLVPPTWVHVADLTEPGESIVMISSTAQIYAPDEASASELRGRLHAYLPRLAPGVTVRFLPG